MFTRVAKIHENSIYFNFRICIVLFDCQNNIEALEFMFCLFMYNGIQEIYLIKAKLY